MTLEGGKPRKCEEYPDKFCRLICEAIQKELEDEQWLDAVHSKIQDAEYIGELMKVQEKEEQPTVPEEEDDLWWYRQLYQYVEFEDDVRGGTLDKEMMIKARRAEMQFSRNWVSTRR